MVPRFLDRQLSDAPGAVGAWYAAYKSYRWGDPYIRLVAALADPNRLSIDVGAHLGDYTFFMKRHSAQCIAFECNPRLVDFLRRRYTAGVDIKPFAVSDHAGEAVLRIPQSVIGAEPQRATIEAGNRLADLTDCEEVTVQLVRLDDAIDRPVGLIKIDVEGHEMAVLRGATRILRQDRPNLIVELEERHVPGCIAAAFDFLAGFGYRGACLAAGKLVPVHPLDGMPDGLWNFVFRYAG